jgi:CHAT domain-containing protein
MAQALGDADEASQVKADTDLKTLQAEADALEGELLAVNPRYNQLVAAAAPVDAIQKALRPDEAYAKLLVLEGRSYGVLVTPQAVKPYAIDLPRAQVEAAVDALRAPFEAQNSLPAFDVAGSQALFEQLFGPVKGDLLAARHLIYEPDGALVSLPVSTFVTDQASVELMQSRKRPGAAPDYRDVAWLSRKMDSSLVVSGASFLQSRAFAPSKASRNFLGFGDPDLPRSQPAAYASLTSLPGRRSASMEAVCSPTRTALLDIPALPETGQEVRAVGASLGAPNDVVLGDAFNDGAIKSRDDLDDYRVLYFATHGLLPQPEGCLPEPALVTSLGGAGSDALLDMSEILEIELDADLVVLAACDTGGAGSESAARTGLAGGGEALGGLARAMIYAGSRGLIVSHWSVDSASAVRVMTGLFASGAPTQAEGLQHAQAALQADPLLSHPYYWAPFDVIGDGARALPGA